MMLNLSIPKEPQEVKKWIRNVEAYTGGPGVDWESLNVWYGNQLPKYLWNEWKKILKPRGFTWQKFLRLLKHRTDKIILWYKGILLTQSQKNNGFWLWDKTPAKTLVGLGDTSQPPIWKFQDHAYNSLNQTDVLDLSFNRVNPSEADHINGLFELINQGTGQTFPNPFPSDIHQFVSHQ